MWRSEKTCRSGHVEAESSGRHTVGDHLEWDASGLWRGLLQRMLVLTERSAQVVEAKDVWRPLDYAYHTWSEQVLSAVPWSKNCFTLRRYRRKLCTWICIQTSCQRWELPFEVYINQDLPSPLLTCSRQIHVISKDLSFKALPVGLEFDSIKTLNILLSGHLYDIEVTIADPSHLDSKSRFN